MVLLVTGFLKHMMCKVNVLMCSLILLQLPDKHGITPLLAAVYEDHEECVKILIEKV